MMVVASSPWLKIVAPASYATRSAGTPPQSIGSVFGAEGRFRFATAVVADVNAEPLEKILSHHPLRSASRLRLFLCKMGAHGERLDAHEPTEAAE